MVLTKDLAEVLWLQVEALEDVEAQLGLERMVLWRRVEGLGLSGDLARTLGRALSGLKQTAFDELVYTILKRRTWKVLLPKVGLEMAVREHLFRHGFRFRVEPTGGGLYTVALERKESVPLELSTPAPWYGMVVLSRRVL